MSIKNNKDYKKTIDRYKKTIKDNETNSIGLEPFHDILAKVNVSEVLWQKLTILLYLPKIYGKCCGFQQILQYCELQSYSDFSVFYCAIYL